MSHDEIISNLREINRYFAVCLDHFGLGTHSEARFVRYIDTVAKAIDIVQDAEKQEDDGK